MILNANYVSETKFTFLALFERNGYLSTFENNICKKKLFNIEKLY